MKKHLKLSLLALVFVGLLFSTSGLASAHETSTSSSSVKVASISKKSGESDKNFIKRLLAVIKDLEKQIKELKKGKSSSKPASDAFTDWKSYKNDKYGFEFKYPGNWKLESSSNAGIIFSSDFVSKNGTYQYIQSGSFIKVADYGEIYQSNSMDSLDQLVQDQTDMSPGIVKNYIKVNGKNAVRFNHMIGENNNSHDVVLVINNGRGYIIEQQFIKNGTQPHKEIMEKIISSFKFTNNSTGSDWKTYKNDKYGFEFKYPAKLSNIDKVVDYVGKKSCGSNEVEYNNLSYGSQISVGIQLVCEGVLYDVDSDNKETITVGGRNGYYVDYDWAPNYQIKEAYIPFTDGTFLVLSHAYNGVYKDISEKDFKTILASFKFTN